MKILVIPHATAVRIRTRAGELARALGEAGHQVDVLTQDVQPPGLSLPGKLGWHWRQLLRKAPEPVSPGVHTIQIRSHFRWAAADQWLLRRELQRLAREPYDFIHTSSYLRHRIVKPCAGRLIYDLVDDHADGYRRAGHHAHADRIDDFIREQIGAADLVTVSALRLQELVRERYGRESVYLPNGVHSAAIRAAGPREPGAEHRIGYMGGLDTYVNIRLVVAAMEKLRASGRPVELNIIGDGEALRGWTPPPWVKPLGFRPPAEIPGLMRSFAVGLLPFELCPLTDAALPLKVLEHGAAKQRVVASPIRELVLQQFPWVRLTPLDVDAWAGALATALDEPWPAEADSIVDRFDWSKVAATLCETARQGSKS